ncbi:Eukaryotic translation initiation factor 2C [Haplosporangium sp. Z 11]|nr:Eukaryotic translation initiation factor 2C [Haplosporangium sp. Z 11]
MSNKPSTSRVPIALTPNARRPEPGSEGKAIRVRTNFFAIKKLQVDTIWHYDIEITPELPSDKARKLWKVIEGLKEIPRNKMVFDGHCNAYAAEELKVEKLVQKVELPEAHPMPKKDSSKKANEFVVKITRVARIELEELHRFLRCEGPITSGCFTAVQALNIVMTHKLFNDMVSVGRSAFTPNNAQDLGGGVERWDGIFQSIRPGQGSLYANIDIASTAFFKGGNIAQLIAEIKNARTPNEIRRLEKRDYRELQQHFKGCSFTVTHRGDSFKKQYKVSALSMMPADQVTFDQETNDGKTKKISIPQYYQAAYSLKLQFPFLPCIGVKARGGDIMYFPAEVCNIVPGKRYTKRLNETQTAEMIKGTCIKPNQRAQKIRQSLPVLGFASNQYMKGFKMEVSNDMEVVPGRVLPPPTVEYARNVSVVPMSGGWQLNPSRKMLHGSTLSSWGVLVCENPKYLPEGLVRNFLRDLTSTLSENGMNVTLKTPHVMYAQPGGNVSKNVETICSTVNKSCKSAPQLILVILPSVCQTYSAIKTYCETTHRTGVMTQCVLANKVKRVTKQYCGMLGLKINSKLGGVNSTLARGSIPFLNANPTLIIGADVTHPGAGEHRPSVVAVVGSMDFHAFKYSGRIQVQDSRVEVIEGLKYLVHELLIAFHHQNNRYPARILFYRDGVSEGQYAEVMKTEVEAIKEACKHVNAKYNPPTTFCIVKKRHHARFFPMGQNDADRSGNCFSGTVVDSVITHPTEFDFYLQSHGGLQGTSRPTLYHVLLDENKFTSDELQSLTFRLCHLYSRCPKAVSIVPPVYYAHLLAFRARHYQGAEFSDTSSTSSGGSLQNVPTFQISPSLKNVMYFV